MSQERSITGNLKKLTAVKKGDDVRNVASSERINAIQETLKAMARGENVVAGVNLRKTLGEGFFILSGQRGGRGGGFAEDTETPFQVVARNNEGFLELGVISNSHLFNSEDRNTYEEDNSDWGLLDDDRVTGWFGAGEIDFGSIGDKIWLKITLDPTDQSITAIDLEHGPAWDGYPDPVNINTDDPDNPFQEFFYQIIAEITDPEQDPRPGLILSIPDTEDKIQVTQLLFANLMMTTAHTTDDADEPGLPLLVAVPWTVLPGTDEDGNADEIPPADDLMTPWQLGDQETRNDYNFELFNASEPGVAKVLILDGVVIGPNDDPVDPDGMPSGDTYTLVVADGDEIWLEITWSTEGDDGVSGENITSVSINNGPVTPDDDGTTQYITIGNVSVDDSGDVPIVTCRNEVCGDVVIQYPPSLDSDLPIILETDVDTGNVVWKKRGIDVASYNLGTDEDDEATRVTKIRFEPAVDPSQAYISLVDEGVADGEHVVTLQVPLIPESPGGTAVLFDDDGDTHWEPTCDAECGATKCGDGDGCP